MGSLETLNLQHFKLIFRKGKTNYISQCSLMYVFLKLRIIRWNRSKWFINSPVHKGNNRKQNQTNSRRRWWRCQVCLFWLRIRSLDIENDGRLFRLSLKCCHFKTRHLKNARLLRQRNKTSCRTGLMRLHNLCKALKLGNFKEMIF